MNKLVLATALVATLILAACGSSAPVPSPSGVPSAAPSVAVVSPEPTIQPSPSASPSAEPSATAVPTPTPFATPAPTAKPTPKPTPKPVSFTRAEKYLIEGIMRGESDCSPVRGDNLPGLAIAGIDCVLVGTPAARMGFYLYKNDDDLLDAYMARVTVENLIVDSGACVPGIGEGAYIPHAEDEFALARHACYINHQGFGNYRATLPGMHVYMGLLGRTKDMRSLQDWAWFGNQDTPGAPTLWQQDHVYKA